MNTIEHNIPNILKIVYIFISFCSLSFLGNSGLIMSFLELKTLLNNFLKFKTALRILNKGFNARKFYGDMDSDERQKVAEKVLGMLVLNHPDTKTQRNLHPQ